MKLMEERGQSIKLKPGSKIMLGGGWKQFYTEQVDKQTFYDLAQRVLGVPEEDVIEFFGGEATPLLQRPELYRTIYVASNVWKNFGWDSIIFVAALAGVDTQLYDAAKVDGAGRWKQMVHVTLPSIMPTRITMLILKIGGMMSVGYEKTLLLYNETIYETADIISTYVYRVGLMDRQYSYAAAVDLFNSLVRTF